MNENEATQAQRQQHIWDEIRMACAGAQEGSTVADCYGLAHLCGSICDSKSQDRISASAACAACAPYALCAADASMPPVAFDWHCARCGVAVGCEQLRR